MGNPEFTRGAFAIPNNSFALSIADPSAISNSSAFTDTTATAATTSDAANTATFPSASCDGVLQRLRWMGLPADGVLILSPSHDTNTAATTPAYEYRRQWRQYRNTATRHVAWS